MNLKLDDVLAREAARAFEMNNECVIEGFPFSITKMDAEELSRRVALRVPNHLS
jgi:hypothetical protein